MRKNNDVEHDFLTDPIETEIDGEWLKAKGTTLGADNGIGVATELAILADDSIEHGPIECLFTVDEETGLTGAFALQEGFLSGDILLNLDSEDEGELFHRLCRWHRLCGRVYLSGSGCTFRIFLLQGTGKKDLKADIPVVIFIWDAAMPTSY